MRGTAQATHIWRELRDQRLTMFRLSTLVAAIVTATAFLAAHPANAQNTGPTQTGEICMQKVFGTPVTNSNRLNCTANDIRISGVAKDAQGNPLVSPSSCIEGSEFTLDATFQVNVTANARYDGGFFFRIDGTGTASSVFTLKVFALRSRLNWRIASGAEWYWSAMRERVSPLRTWWMR